MIRILFVRLICLVFIGCPVLAQFAIAQNKILLAGNLEITKLSAHTYIHTSDGSNGMVYVNKGECIIVSTPSTDNVTRELIKWIQDSLGATIKGCIIDSWHPDNMEGLDVVHASGIRSYANVMTREIAKAKKLPIPQTGFRDKMELKVGNALIEVRYLGPAHTSDGIVVWIPAEKILFGSNAVRNYKGWIGNISDADVNRWSETIKKIRNAYSTARIVIPGHGNHGDIALLDYTINLYKPSKWVPLLKKNNIKASRIFEDFGDIFVSAEQDSAVGQINFLKNATVLIDKEKQYLIIESGFVTYDTGNRMVESDYGRIRVINRSAGSALPETDGYYKNLKVNLRNDAVGMTIVIRELIR